MRAINLFAALAIVATPMIAAAPAAYADGIERPRQRAARPAPAPPLLGAPEAPPVESNTVTLPASFFVGGGGVGADVGVGGYSSTTVIVHGASASASAFAHASARAGVGARGGHGGRGCSGCR